MTNSGSASEKITFAAYLSSNPLEVALLLVLLLIILAAAVFLFIKYRSRKAAYISALEVERARLTDLAQRDSLTGLYNAITCQTLISAQLASEDGKSGTLLVIDIDYFKTINDTFGHFTGDQVLKQVSGIFSQIFPPGAIVGRRGGDEFMIYLPNVYDRASVTRICSQLGMAIKKAVLTQDGKPVSVSIGASTTGGEKPFDALYREADMALYSVKSRGRDGYEIIDMQPK